MRSAFIRVLAACLFALTSIARAADLEVLVLRRDEGPDARFIQDDVERIRTSNGTPIEEIRAHTNDPDIVAQYIAELAEETAPRSEPNGIEAPVIVLQSRTNDWGIGIIASDDGDLVTYMDHQSPRPDDPTLQARRDSAIAAHQAEKAAYKALLAAIVADTKLDKATKDAATNMLAAVEFSEKLKKPKKDE
jgi:hypothetical protein